MGQNIHFLIVFINNRPDDRQQTLMSWNTSYQSGPCQTGGKCEMETKVISQKSCSFSKWTQNESFIDYELTCGKRLNACEFLCSILHGG
jgi:hypothetical protein